MIYILYNINIMRIKGKRILKNGVLAGYVQQKDGSWKWRFISGPKKKGGNEHNLSNSNNKKELKELIEKARKNYKNKFNGIYSNYIDVINSQINNNFNKASKSYDDFIEIINRDNKIYKVMTLIRKKIESNKHPIFINRRYNDYIKRLQKILGKNINHQPDVIYREILTHVKKRYHEKGCFKEKKKKNKVCSAYTELCKILKKKKNNRIPYGKKKNINDIEKSLEKLLVIEKSRVKTINDPLNGKKIMTIPNINSKD